MQNRSCCAFQFPRHSRAFHKAMTPFENKSKVFYSNQFCDCDSGSVVLHRSAASCYNCYPPPPVHPGLARLSGRQRGTCNDCGCSICLHDRRKEHASKECGAEFWRLVGCSNHLKSDHTPVCPSTCPGCGQIDYKFTALASFLIRPQAL